MNELKKGKVKEILKALMNGKTNDNRFDNAEQIQIVITNFLKMNLFDTNKFKVTVTEKPENEIDNIDIDYLLVGSIKNLENGDIFDFDIYYTKTRANKIYPVEFIIQ